MTASETFLLPESQAYPNTPTYAYDCGPDTPLVIDNGSHSLRAGWATDSDPKSGPVHSPVHFDNIIAKYRGGGKAKQMDAMLVGNDVHIGGLNSNSKSAFEAGVVFNAATLETTLDYVLSKLGIDTESVAHPILMTETLCNPAYSRRLVSELLFEGYGIPSVVYGVDSLFSYYQNNGSFDAGIVVDAGNVATHVIPLYDGRGRLQHAKRVGIGGQYLSDHMLKLLQFKYPTFPHRVTSEQTQGFVQNHSYVSLDYTQELRGLRDPKVVIAQTHVLQFPFTTKVADEIDPAEAALQLQKRKEQGKRLQEQAMRMREEKLIEKEANLASMKQLAAEKDKEAGSVFRRHLHAAGFETEAELESAIKTTELAVKRSRNRMEGIEEPEEKVIPTFPLVDTPDSELTDEQKKDKRRQRLMKAGWEARERTRIAKEEEKKREEALARQDEERRTADPIAWLDENRNKRQILLNRIYARIRRKAKLTDRRSKESQQRMRNIASLAAEEVPIKRKRGGNNEDTFGADDDDWGIYREISKEDDSDEDNDAAELAKLDQVLLTHDPEFVPENPFDGGRPFSNTVIYHLAHGTHAVDLTEPAIQSEIHLNVERIRVPELLFQPSIVGLDQAGLVETLDEILKRFDAGQQAKMVQNIFLTGGTSLLKNMAERIEADIRAVQPFQSIVRVTRAKDPVLDPWRGAAKWASASSPSEFQASGVTRAMYDEMGHDYLIEHSMSNAAVPH
ncbi:Nuclear actin-protein involved in chromatin remodeling [Geranomyces variabilis]|nr:Nuclear actin-protein involved in chromatin remodeling [Geranomyces variabilis]